MKLLSPVLLLTVALVAAGAHASNALQKRDIFDDIKNGVQGAFDNLVGGINIGHADTPEDDETTPSKATTTTTSTTPTQPAKSTLASSTPSKSTPSSTSQKATSSKQPLTTNSGDDDKDASSTTTTTTSSSSPTPTGEACKGSIKRCPTVGESTYQQCLNNVWTNQKCGSSLVCGLDSQGSVACMSKEQATTVYDKCTGNAKRCHPSESTKYQQCNGSFWESFVCDKASKCSLDGNKNVICGSPSGNGGSSSSVTYSLVKPQPFVPESTAPLSAKLAVSAIAVALVAAAFGF